MIDNTTSHMSEYYDSQVIQTIPYYEQFHTEVINIIKIINDNPKRWLDTGCGTGTLAQRALDHFAGTEFLLADPSEGMLAQARSKFQKYPQEKVNILGPVATQDIILDNDKKIDVITAIQSHHYLSQEERRRATRKCYDLLADGGIYITFENIRPFTDEGTEIGKEYWKSFQVYSGKSESEAEKHIQRFGVEFLPITVEQHIELLRKTGFKAVESFWYSYMQAGFYCIK